MIYTHRELKDKGMSNYNINKKVENKELYKIENGLYSDTERYNQLEYIVKNIQIVFLHQKVLFSI